jgi:hypothetical protein
MRLSEQTRNENLLHLLLQDTTEPEEKSTPHLLA